MKSHGDVSNQLGGKPKVKVWLCGGTVGRTGGDLIYGGWIWPGNILQHIIVIAIRHD